MTLAALATASDVAARGVSVTAGELALLGVYLDVASAVVRQAAGVPISQITVTVEVEGTVSQWLRLPGGLVTAVSAVAIDGVALTLDTDYVLRSGLLWRRIGWQSLTTVTPSKVAATYTVGLLTVPADIVDLVCRLAATTLVAYRAQPDGEGLASTGNKRQETLGDYSVTWGTGGAITEMVLADMLVERLAARFGNNIALVRSR